VSLQLLFGRQYLSELPALMESATTHLRVAQYVAQVQGRSAKDSSLVLVNKLWAKRRDGVEVRLLLNRHGLQRRVVVQNQTVAQYLAGVGVRVCYPVPDVLLHGKLVVIDERLAVVGSHNWTAAALEDNWEISVVVDDPAIVLLLAQHFDVLWSAAQRFPVKEET